MDFSIESASTGGSSLTWLGSTHGIDAGQPGTLDLASFAGVIDAFGVIKSGTAVVQNDTTKRFELLTAATNTANTPLAGYILSDVSTLGGNGLTLASGKASFALLKHGTIVRSKLPVVAQRTIITHAAPASTGQFVYAD